MPIAPRARTRRDRGSVRPAAQNAAPTDIRVAIQEQAMKRTPPHQARTPGGPRRRRPSPALGLFDIVPEHKPAPPPDDGAEQLMNDLVELIDAGLVVTVDIDGQTHYAAAPVDPDDADP
jgi:hypothetical protein